MTNWRPSKFFCRICGAWYSNVTHKGCPFGEGGLVWIDLDTFNSGCNLCNQTWPLANAINICSYGHQQQVEYTQSTLVVEAEDQIIGTDGDTVYVLKRSGVLVIGYGGFLDQGYD